MTPGSQQITGRYRVPIVIIMIFIINITGMPCIYAQQKSTRQSSIEAFSQGDYAEAYIGFKELLVTYPKDPLYKYYSGICLLELKREPEEALMLLKQAHQGSAVVRTIPPDALFWLGRAQQMTGRFTEAISSFNEFTEQYGKKAARDLDIPGYLQQCQERRGQITEPSPKPVATEKNTPKQSNTLEKAAVQKANAAPVTRKTQDTIPPNFDFIMSEALENQFKADSLTRTCRWLEEWP